MTTKSRKTGRPSLGDVLATLDEEINLLRTSLGGLPRAVEADQILRDIWIDDVHNSTAIEGNTMTRHQVENLVERGQASASLVESLEVEGYARAADWVYRTAPDERGVSLAAVREIHRLAVELAWAVEPPTTRDTPGAWRTAGVRVRNVRVSLPPAIDADMNDWSQSTARRNDDHPILHAAHHHAWFERIHPFVDGNGRVGRLVLNYLLLQAGYPPAIILKETRPRYLQALSAADAGNPNALGELVARAVSAALHKFLIPNLAGDARLVPLASLATGGPYRADYLRQLALSGKLKAVRNGRLYLSSRAWLDDYIRTRDPRGGPVPRHK